MAAKSPPNRRPWQAPAIILPTLALSDAAKTAPSKPESHFNAGLSSVSFGDAS
jgi:hypothetical protein